MPENNPSPCTEKSRPGVVVPIPSLPLASIVNISMFDELEITNTRSMLVPEPVTESFAVGEVVPIPTFPEPRRLSKVEEELPTTSNTLSLALPVIPQTLNLA